MVAFFVTMVIVYLFAFSVCHTQTFRDEEAELKYLEDWKRKHEHQSE